MDCFHGTSIAVGTFPNNRYLSTIYRPRIILKQRPRAALRSNNSNMKLDGLFESLQGLCSKADDSLKLRLQREQFRDPRGLGKATHEVLG